MRLRLPIILAALAVGGVALGYWGGVRLVPYRMMSVQMARFEQVAGGENRMLVGPPGRNLRRPIEKANPDIQPANCVYDLSDGAVRLHGPVWDGYWSLSFFQANSDNYAILTDRELDDRFDVILVRKGGPRPSVTPPGARVIESPSVRGITMIRMFVGTEDDKRRAHAAARASRCEPYPLT